MKLSEKQMEFLKGYMPSDRHFTIEEEIAKIREIIPATQECRNAVVKFYDELFESAENREKGYDYMTAMQSVTTVIDHVRYGLI